MKTEEIRNFLVLPGVITDGKNIVNNDYSIALMKLLFGDEK